jgi:hypothetical protein
MRPSRLDQGVVLVVQPFGLGLKRLSLGSAGKEVLKVTLDPLLVLKNNDRLGAV